MIKSARWDRLKSQWAVLSFYQRFESAVALVLTFVIGLIVLVALFRLTLSVVTGLLWGALDPLDQAVFQSVFGEVLTLLIALEFNHTLQYVVTREQIAAGELLGLAAITLALGIVYWLMRERDDRLVGASKRDSK
jgi:uncharacterized membrane protein (DUF373 family)